MHSHEANWGNPSRITADTHSQLACFTFPSFAGGNKTNQSRNSSHFFFHFRVQILEPPPPSPTWSLPWKKKEKKGNAKYPHNHKSNKSPLKGPLALTLCFFPPIVSIMYEQTADKSEKFYDATEAFLIALSSWPDSVEVLITTKLQIMNVTQRKHNLFNGEMVKNWTGHPQVYYCRLQPF